MFTVESADVLCGLGLSYVKLCGFLLHFWWEWINKIKRENVAFKLNSITYKYLKKLVRKKI